MTTELFNGVPIPEHPTGRIVLLSVLAGDDSKRGGAVLEGITLGLMIASRHPETAASLIEALLVLPDHIDLLADAPDVRAECEACADFVASGRLADLMRVVNDTDPADCFHAGAEGPDEDGLFRCSSCGALVTFEGKVVSGE